MYVLLWRTVSALTRVLFWCLFIFYIFIDWNKHQNNTLVSAKTVRYSGTYIILSIYDVISAATIYEYYTL